MKLINDTGVPAAYNVALDRDGRELLVVVVKATLRMPADGDRSDASWRLHAEQVPLHVTDVYAGEPGRSMPLYDADFAPRKNACDILLHGNAYAPGGTPAERVEVGVQMGDWAKRFAVVGERRWRRDGERIGATRAQPFSVQRLGYDHAFGGVDPRPVEGGHAPVYPDNPVGIGFHAALDSAALIGSALPTSEELAEPIQQPGGPHRPMAFGPLARGWPDRARHAGTYDEAWCRGGFPFLPADFDDRFHQAAPVDQQRPLDALAPVAEQITLTHVTPGGHCVFSVPTAPLAVQLTPRRGPTEALLARLDTVLIEPELQRCCLSWRLTRPLRKNIFDIAQVQLCGPLR